MLEFRYTANSLVAPDKVLFQYCLEGCDQEWTDAGTRRVAFYTNLRPGQYTFRVRACNNHGVWNATGAGFSFHLAPHFYQTSPFYAVCVISVALAMTIGVTIGLIAGFFGGRIDNLLMRIGDTVLSIPTLLVAILVSAVFRELLPQGLREGFSAAILVLAIALTGWVQYARTVRGSTMVERNKEYVQAARVIGVAPLRVMFRHVLPNVLGPVLVLATIQIASAIITEATALRRGPASRMGRRPTRSMR